LLYQPVIATYYLAMKILELRCHLAQQWLAFVAVSLLHMVSSLTTSDPGEYSVTEYCFQDGLRQAAWERATCSHWKKNNKKAELPQK